jgi:hypothetical protein
MQMKKTLGILLAVCFLISVTAAAVSARSDNDYNNRWMVKTKAVDDHFKLDSKKDKGNVLRNDKGRDLKVISTWGAKGKVSMKKNGEFKYTPFRSREKTIRDSFKYAIKGKDGKISVAKVKITFENKDRDDHGDDGHGGPR